MKRLEFSGAVRLIYGSLGVKRLIIVQRDKTQSSLLIILQVHSTCFWCQPNPPTGVHKTVTTASGTLQLPPSDVANMATLEGGSCTKHITSTSKASGTVQLPPSNVASLATLEGGSCTKHVTSTGSCS